MSNFHSDYLSRGRRGRFVASYLPGTTDEIRAYVQNSELQELAPEVLRDLWIRPAARHLQTYFGIDPRNLPSVPGSEEEGADQIGNYSPTREQLDRDFTVGIAIYLDKIADNPEDVRGVDTAEGSSRRFDHAIPDRVIALLEPYRRPVKRIRRS